jgi:hypothetical protein
MRAPEEKRIQNIVFHNQRGYDLPASRQSRNSLKTISIIIARQRAASRRVAKHNCFHSNELPFGTFPDCEDWPQRLSS